MMADHPPRRMPRVVPIMLLSRKGFLAVGLTGFEPATP